MNKIEVNLKSFTVEVDLSGKPGMPGNDGENGQNGESAYQVWLDLGNTGTEQDFINSLKGTNDYTQLINKPDLNIYVLKVNGKDLSTNDFTNTYKTKLDGLTNYILPFASAISLGGIRIGSGLSIDANGIVSTTGGGGGSGDMLKSTYDTNNNGIVDNSERLNNQLSTYYLDRSNATGTQNVSTISDFTTASNTNFNTNFNSKVLDDISDVNITSLSDGQSIKYDSSSQKWINYTIVNYSLPIASTTTLGGVKVDGTTIIINGAGVISAVGGGGSGLINFTDTISTTSPNDTIYASRLQSQGTTDNVDMVLSPKGNGSVMLSSPTGTTSGGNKRGLLSIDLQLNRGAANQVASGFLSALVGGYQNLCAGVGAIIAGGLSNIINSSGSNAFIGGGEGHVLDSTDGAIVGGSVNSVVAANYSGIFAGMSNNITGNSQYCVIASGSGNTINNNCTYSGILSGSSNTITNNSTNSAIIGGQNNTINNNSSAGSGIFGASFAQVLAGNSLVLGGFQNRILTGANNSVSIGGFGNTANAQYSFVCGSYSHTKGISNSFIFSSGNANYTANGSRQLRKTGLYGTTPLANSVVLTNDGTSPSSSNQITFQIGETKLIKGDLVIRQVADLSRKSHFEVKIMATRDNSGTLTIDNDATFNYWQSASGTSDGQDLIIAVDSTNNAINFTITKSAGTDIEATFYPDITEMFN